jgi:hypothetical protein
MVGNQSGSILILIVLLVSLLAFIPIGAELLSTARKQVKLQANANAQAVNVARAGLVDAEAWFRMQPLQPVSQSRIGLASCPYPDAAFYPRTSTDTALSATEDETIGLVKTFKMGESTNLYGRYEVPRQTDPDNNGVISGVEYSTHAAHDITASRVSTNANGDGYVWSVESVGYVYQLKDSSKAYNQYPNVVVGRARVATEVRRMAVTTYGAAVTIYSRDNGNVGSNCRVTGGSGFGVAKVTGTGGTWTSTTGTPAFTSTSSWTMASVFGLPASDIRMAADYCVTSVSQLPSDYPSTALVFVDGNATFDDTHALSGGGVLIVNGNLTVQSTSNALFSGVIFVQGNAVINGPALISGTIILGSNSSTLTMSGTTDVAEVQYDAAVLSTIRQNVGQYRQNKSAYHVFSALK